MQVSRGRGHKWGTNSHENPNEPWFACRAAGDSVRSVACGYGELSLGWDFACGDFFLAVTPSVH